MSDDQLYEDTVRLSTPIAKEMLEMVNYLIALHAETMLAMKENAEADTSTVAVEGTAALYPGHRFRLVFSLDPEEPKHGPGDKVFEGGRIKP